MVHAPEPRIAEASAKEEEDMTYTAQVVREEIEPDRDDMMKSLEEDTEVPPVLKKSKHFHDVWLAGCWLNAKLKNDGCPEERISKIGFEHGQRSFHGDTYALAASLFNAYAEGTLQERPGEELAKELIAQNTSRGEDGTIVMRVGSEDMKSRMEGELERLKAMTPEELQAEKERLEEKVRAADPSR